MLSHTLAFRNSSQVCDDPANSELIIAMELQRSLTPNGIWFAFIVSLLGFLWTLSSGFLTVPNLEDRFPSYYGFSQTEKWNSCSFCRRRPLLCQPGFLANYQLPYMASNTSRSQTFLELVDMKMKIDSSAHSGLWSCSSVELSPFDILERYSSFP